MTGELRAAEPPATNPAAYTGADRLTSTDITAADNTAASNVSEAPDSSQGGSKNWSQEDSAALPEEYTPLENNVENVEDVGMEDMNKSENKNEKTRKPEVPARQVVSCWINRF